MDKNKLIQIIRSSRTPQDLKKELIDLIEKEETFGPETVKKVKSKLDEKADESLRILSDLMVESAMDEFNQDLEALGAKVNKFQIELNKKADKIDLKATRAGLNE